MTLHTLPLELHIQIIQHADNQSALYSLALCCRAFRDEAQRKLFRHPVAAWISPHIKLLHAIIFSPARLAPMVKSCVMVESWPMDPSDIEVERHIAATALRCMYNLTSLEVERPACVDIAALMECTFKLDVLIWGSRITTEEIPPMLFAFLGTQPTLRRLTVHGPLLEDVNRTALRDNLKWCPNLLHLGAQQNLLDIFLAGHRTIRYLQCFRLSFVSTQLATIPLSRLIWLAYLTIAFDQACLDFSFLEQMTSLVLLDVRTGYPIRYDASTQVLSFN
jgi:hypothetical protein